MFRAYCPRLSYQPGADLATPLRWLLTQFIYCKSRNVASYCLETSYVELFVLRLY